MTHDARTNEPDVKVPDGGVVSNQAARPFPQIAMKGNNALVPDETPHMASAQTLWSRRARSVVVVLLVGMAVAYTLWGTILARNVTFNQSQGIDPGASNGIRRFSRETIIDVWRTMWDKAPDFGTIDLTRGILLVSTFAFFAAFALVISLIFVPSRQEWSAGLGDGQESDTIAGD